MMRHQTVTVWVVDPSEPEGVAMLAHRDVHNIIVRDTGSGFLDLEYADGRRAGHPLSALLRWEVQP